MIYQPVFFYGNSDSEGFFFLGTVIIDIEYIGDFAVGWYFMFIGKVNSICKPNSVYIVLS